MKYYFNENSNENSCINFLFINLIKMLQLILDKFN